MALVEWSCIVVTIISIVEAFEQRKLFYPTLTTRYCISLVGNDYFWLAWDVFLLGKTLVFPQNKDIQHEGFSNLPMKRMFCKDQAFSSSLHFGGFEINEEINNGMDGTLEDKSSG
jgi:hypothetical protein